MALMRLWMPSIEAGMEWPLGVGEDAVKRRPKALGDGAGPAAPG